MPPKVDTVILGAGLSGLSAAYKLSKAGRTVQVIEARNRIGGRAWTDNSLGIPVELGCMAIHGYKEGNPVLEYVKTLGLETTLPPASPGILVTKDGPISQDLTQKLRANLGSAMAEMNDIVALTSAPTTESVADVILRPESPLYQGLPESDKPKATALARTMELGWGIPLEEAAADWAGWASSIAFAGSDGVIVGGYSKLASALRTAAEETGNASFVLDTRASKITRTDDGVQLEASNGQTFVARTALCTIPLGVLKTLPKDFFVPRLPGRKISATSRTAVGVLDKLGLLYDSVWWDSSAGSFTVLLESGTVLVIPISTSPPCLHVLVPHGLVGVSTDEMHDTLAKAISPKKSVSKPTKVVSSGWKTDDLAYGATSSPVKVGERRSPLDFAELGRPVWDGLLGFSGEATEMDHRGSVPGAILSGEREARRIQALLER